MNPGRFLAIDAGKTSTRAVLVDGGARGEVARGPGLDNVATVGADGRIAAALAATIAPLGLGTSDGANGGTVGGATDGTVGAATDGAIDGVIDGVCLGLTGVLEPGPHARRVLDLLGQLVEARRMVVTSDVVTSYCGALGPRPGVVVAAGTGAITLGVGSDGTLARVDGWGYLLDDAGSAFAIGRAGLREALRVHDGRGGSVALQRAANERFGSAAALVDAVYGSDNTARTIASFAREVSAVADTGDPVALDLLRTAGTSLADSVIAAARATAGSGAPVQVSWCGGVFTAGEPVVAPFRQRVEQALPAAELVPPAGDALDGAVTLAAAVEPTVVDGLLLATDRTRS